MHASVQRRVNLRESVVTGITPRWCSRIEDQALHEGDVLRVLKLVEATRLPLALVMACGCPITAMVFE